MANGILIVDKPADWTSQDVVAKLRGAFHERRVGHGGTLDPMATGVLPVFFGRATRAVEFFEHADKTYLATLRLGMETDTEDTTGRILRESRVTVTEDEVRALLPTFLGRREQIPPMYSALKIGGKKLYELARAGKEVERKPREIELFELTLLSMEGAECQLRVHCSKGTYVRTLCRDIGAALGCGGCMSALRRIQAGSFTEAIPLDKILSHPSPESLLLPIDTLFFDCSAVILTTAQEKCCRNGASFSTKLPSGRYRLYTRAGDFLALGAVSEGKMRNIKSFFEPMR